METKQWTPFYFDGNQAWGWIDSPKEWQRIKHAYVEASVDLSTARKNLANDRPAYGFYHEYSGEDTLGKFAERHNMNIS